MNLNKAKIMTNKTKEKMKYDYPAITVAIQIFLARKVNVLYFYFISFTLHLIFFFPYIFKNLDWTTFDNKFLYILCK